MHMYFSGIGGVGIGPLAEIAADMGHQVTGSDLSESLVTTELQQRGIAISFLQDGTFLQATHRDQPIDWFAYTASLPETHPELVLAKQLGIRTGKRDEVLTALIQAKGLQLVAVAGTHGKTTTTGMTVWALQQLGIPVSYSVGTTLPFGPSGHYQADSQYFVYECDEFDRNFLHFYPSVSIITSVDYDHPDTYPTVEAYKAAFRQFIQQSSQTILWEAAARYLQLPDGDGQWRLKPDELLPFALAGQHNRANATLVAKAIEYLKLGESEAVKKALDNFPGTDRRFEKLADNLYSDYGHHPVEIAATLQLARELSDRVVLVYQPHQNRRQHEIRNDYTNQFELADTIYWVPTYLSREDASLPILRPEELTTHLTNQDRLVIAELNQDLWEKLEAARSSGALVLVMGAGTIDGWVRSQLAATS